MKDRISGLLNEVPFGDLLRLLVTSQKTGVCTVQADEELGRVYLSEGTIIGAFILSNGDLSGREAFLKIFNWKTGYF